MAEQTIDKALTVREKELLKTLRFRATGETDPDRQVCWLGMGQRDRWSLIVPTICGAWEHLEWFNGRTLSGLWRRELIAYGPDEDLPGAVASWHRTSSGRRFMVRYGSTVRITDAGLAAIDKQAGDGRG